MARALKKPAPEPPPSWLTWENGLKLVALGTKVGSAYYRHQRYWSEREERVLAAARAHHGWLTEAGLLEALEYRHQEVDRVTAGLCERGLCRRLVSRQGQPLYLFEAFLPAMRFCDYCDQERAGGVAACTCCGAP
ncbi:hypothetical protein ABS71_01830 [bacterium SCN 62-11]|nr:MAG: hypothetical protein ABS71_01830 [bacterium SCN 62-11]